VPLLQALLTGFSCQFLFGSHLQVSFADFFCRSLSYTSSAGLFNRVFLSVSILALLIIGYAGFLCRYEGLFWGYVGLFCGYAGLSCQFLF